MRVVLALLAAAACAGLRTEMRQAPRAAAEMRQAARGAAVLRQVLRAAAAARSTARSGDSDPYPVTYAETY